METSTGHRRAHRKSSEWSQIRRAVRPAAWIVLCMALLSPPPLLAQEISGTEGDDVIVVPSGTTAESVESLGGDDIVTVQTGAGVADHVVSTGEDADAQVTGIDMGTGDDHATNLGVVEMTAEAGAEADEAGATATAVATAIEEGDGTGVVTNTGMVSTTATATADASDTAWEFLDTDLEVNVATTSSATAAGIIGGADIDAITNVSALIVTSTAASTADATSGAFLGKAVANFSMGAAAVSTGIDGGAGGDILQNQGLLTVTAVSNIETDGVSLSGFGAAQVNNSRTDASRNSRAEATGISGGVGPDWITNSSVLNVTSDSTANSDSYSLTLVGDALSDTSIAAYAHSIGIDGGGGNDTITNAGSLTVGATATSEAWTMDLNFIDIFEPDSSVTADTNSWGVRGADGDDTITNVGTIAAVATSTLESHSLQLNSVDAAVGDFSNTATSSAVGIEGGSGDDTIVNGGTVTATSQSDVTVGSYNLTLVDVTVIPERLDAIGDASTTVTATATGLSGGKGDDVIVSTGGLTATATADALTIGVSVGAEGVPSGIISGDILSLENLADASVYLTSETVGIDGGTGDDVITNWAPIWATSTSTSWGVGVSLSLPLLERIVPIPSPAFALASAGTDVSARAAGILGGEGSDLIYNYNDLTATATSQAVNITAALAFQGFVSPVEIVDLAAARADAQTILDSEATGIGGENGDEVIVNTGTITATATSQTVAVGASVAVQGQVQQALNVEGTLADVRTTTDATATGISGDEGNDIIETSGNIIATAHSRTAGVSFSAAIVGEAEQGLIANAAVARADTVSNAYAAGVDGGAGDDYIHNQGRLDVDATAESLGLSLGLALQGSNTSSLGLAGALVTATTTTDANAFGLTGGEGDDVIENDGALYVTADSDGYAFGIDAAIVTSESASLGIALASAQNNATSTAGGIVGGQGHTTIQNRNIIDVDAEALAVAAAISVTNQGAAGSTTFNPFSLDARNSAHATAMGIEGCQEEDDIANFSNVSVTADAMAVSVDVSAALNGVALAMTSGEATAQVTGMAGSEGGQRLRTTGTLDVDADAEAWTVAVSATKNGVAAVADAVWDGGTLADATAVGIDGGGGDDTISQEGTVTADADAEAYSNGVSFSLQGFAAAVMTSTATAASTGIHGGLGADTIQNTGTIHAGTRVDAWTLNISAVANGAAVTANDVWDSGTEAIATAVGIDGGKGNDTIINTGTITVGPYSGDDDNMAEAYANGVSFALNGFAGSVMSSTATAVSTGIAGGDGKDAIRNDNLIDVDATSDAWTLSVSGNYQGVAIAADAVWDGGTTAEATVTGMDGGSDTDQLENNGTVDVSAEATTNSTGVSGSVYGVAGTIMTSTAHTWSTGIAGGDGNDTIQNTGLLTADATSEAGTNNIALNGAGVALAADAVWDGGTSAEATALGIDGGAGDDVIINTGTITVGHDTDDEMAYARSTGISGNAAGFVATVVTSTARTRSVGIYGGEGTDTIENQGTITVDGTSQADTQNIALTAAGVSGAVDAVWDGGTTAEATAIGIEACKGVDDTNSIANFGSIDVGARAEATSTGVSSSLAGGLSASIATSTARVRSIGIQGGDYHDTVYNGGFIAADGYAETDTVGVSATWVGATVSADAVWDGGTTSEARALGISAEGGNDTVVNDGTITVGHLSGDAMAHADSTQVSAPVFGGIGGSAATSEALTWSTGIAGGTGTDTIRNYDTITVMGSSEADSVGVSATLVGAVASADAPWDAGTTAETTAVGIDGGQDSDDIETTGTMTVTAHADASSDQIAVPIAGVAAAMATATSHAWSTGIQGGTGNDIIRNSGTITADANSDAESLSVSATLIGAVASDDFIWDSATTAEATVIGIDGAEGDDSIINTGTITVGHYDDAMSETTGTGVSGTIVGAAFAGVTTRSTTLSTGIAGGKGQDYIRNEGTIGVAASAATEVDTTSVSIAVYGEADADTTAEATAVGIDGGDDGDTLVNTGIITAWANSTADASSVSVTPLVGGAIAEAGTTARTTAIGMGGGAGSDWIENTNAITATATSYTDASNTTVSLIGSAEATAETTAEATAVGITGDDGDDRMVNTGSITAAANASSDAGGVSVNPLAGQAAADTGSTVRATAIGIQGGRAIDRIQNDGTISVTALSYTNASNTLVSIIGSASGDGSTTAEATGIGIDGGEGDDHIVNTGSIAVSTRAKTDAGNTSVNPLAGQAQADAVTTARAVATGIAGGTGNDSILNTGTITLGPVAGSGDPMARAHASGSAWSLFGQASMDSTLTAETTMTGIDGGEGDDVIVNEGTISVGIASGGELPGSTSRAETSSWQFGGEASTDALMLATSTSMGISGGVGNDAILNTGSIAVAAFADESTGDPEMRGNANTFAGDAEAGGDITGSATAVGIHGGDGNNEVLNEGAITVTAETYPNMTGSAGQVFGGPSASGTARGNATATGIAGGQDNDVIENIGTIQANANSQAGVSTSATTGWGGPSGYAITNTVSSAAAVDAGDGLNWITNSGTLGATATAGTDSRSFSDSDMERTYTRTIGTSEAHASGIRAGDGDTTLWNEKEGEINVSASASTYAEARTDEDANIWDIGWQYIPPFPAPILVPVPGAEAVAEATGMMTGVGENELINQGHITVTANATVAARTRADSNVYDTYNVGLAMSEAVATGLSIAGGTGLIVNNGNAEVNATSTTNVNQPSDGTGTYWRSDSWYDADATVTASASARATGIEAGDSTANDEEEKDTGDDVLIANSGTLDVTATSTAEGNSRADSGAGDGNATTRATADADAFGITVGNGHSFVAIDNSGVLAVESIADAWSLAHGDDDSYSYATAYGDASAIAAGDDNDLILIKNSGTLTVASTATARTADDEPTMNANASDTAYGIRVGNSDSVIKNTGEMNILSTASAVAQLGNDYIAYTTSSANATGISTGTGDNEIWNGGRIEVAAHTNNGPDDTWYTVTTGGSDSASALACGIGTSDGADTIIVGTDAEIVGTATAHTATYQGSGTAQSEVIGIDAGNGLNHVSNYGSIDMTAGASAHPGVSFEFPLFGTIVYTWPATAMSLGTGIKGGGDADRIDNFGDITVRADANAYWAVTPNMGGGIKTADATAMGIDAGDGDNVLQNYGTIDVQASALAGTLASNDGTTDFHAIGISTGSGNDTIINSGSISATNQVDFGAITFTWPDTAISSGDGNDTVALLEGSNTFGTIDVGAGDDAVWFAGSPVLNGYLLGAEGTDSLVFDGNGSVCFAPMGFETAIKGGSGTYTVAGLPTVQRLEVHEGTLEIDHDYQFAPDGTYLTRIHLEGYGRLQVNGTAGLDGTMAVVADRRAFHNGDTFDVLMADDVVHEFAAFDLPSPKPLLSFDVHYLEDPDIVQVEVSTQDCSTVATNSAETSIAKYLDDIIPTATGDLSHVLGEFQSLSSREEFKTAFLSMSPGCFDNSTKTTFNVMRRYSHILQQRMYSLRAHMTNPPGSIRARFGDESIMLAYTGSNTSLADLVRTRQRTSERRRFDLWLQGFSQWGDQDSDDEFTGYDYGMSGLTGGFDYAFTDRFLAGIDIGYSNSTIDFSRNAGDGDIKSTYGALYGTYFTDRWYVDGTLTYSRNRYDNDRNVMVGAIQRVATSDHDGDAFSGALEAGYTIPAKDWLLQPFASLQYTYLDEDGFTETGADAMNMIVDDRQTESLFSELGLRVARAFPISTGTFVPEASMAWKYDFDIDNDAVTASFAGSPNVAFSVDGQDVEQHAAVLGLGLTFLHKSGFAIWLKYDAELREDYTGHGIIGEISYTF